MASKTSILQEALTITSGKRHQDYGSAKESFDRIAMVASLLLNKRITAVEVAIILKCVKLVRESYGGQRDNLVDECGYARIEAILKGYEKEE